MKVSSSIPGMGCMKVSSSIPGSSSDSTWLTHALQVNDGCFNPCSEGTCLALADGELLQHTEVPQAILYHAVQAPLPGVGIVQRPGGDIVLGEPENKGRDTFSAVLVRGKRLKLWNTKPIRRLRIFAKDCSSSPATSTSMRAWPGQSG